MKILVVAALLGAYTAEPAATPATYHSGGQILGGLGSRPECRLPQWSTAANSSRPLAVVGVGVHDT